MIAFFCVCVKLKRKKGRNDEILNPDLPESGRRKENSMENT